MQINTLIRNARLLRMIGTFIQSWKLLALAWFFLSSVSPHLRLTDPYKTTHYGPNCPYLGNRGIVSIPRTTCPFLILTNAHHGVPIYD